jgi:hypothetical protein
MADPAIPKPIKKSRYVRTVIKLPGEKQISVYAGRRIREALTEVSANLNLYRGVKLSQVLEAVYEQGKKDGARNVFDTVDGLKRTIAYRNPGQPRKRRKPAGRKRRKK